MCSTGTAISLLYMLTLVAQFTVLTIVSRRQQC